MMGYVKIAEPQRWLNYVQNNSNKMIIHKFIKSCMLQNKALYYFWM